MIHWFDDSFATIGIHFKNLWPYNLLNGFWKTWVDIGPAWLIHLWWFRRIVLSSPESATSWYVWHMVLGAHHEHSRSGFRGLLLKYLLRWLDLKHFTLNLPLSVPLLRAVHVLDYLSLPHLFLVCLLLPPNIILAWMLLIILLLRLVIELAYLFTQCSLGIVPQMHMVLSFVIVPVLIAFVRWFLGIP